MVEGLCVGCELSTNSLELILPNGIAAMGDFEILRRGANVAPNLNRGLDA